MANPEHLEILNQGVEAWNDWRRRNPLVAPDLGGSKLVRADLRGANLSEAHLTEADLGGAALQGADFTLANLERANLAQASLVRAGLYRVSLRNASLCLAFLGWANFTGAELGGADLGLAITGGTTFGDNDLSDVKGLETVRHFGPSTIGIDTIFKSKGSIPEVFLRGCGVPEDFILYMRSIASKAMEFYSCFISYSSKDDDFAKRLYADLQTRNVRCWFAPEDLKIGDKFQDSVEESIGSYDKLLPVLSENSIESAWVEQEVQAGLEKERKSGNLVLFPLRLDEAVMETSKAWAANLRRTRHVGDFTRWKDHDAYEQSFQRLLRDLKAEQAPPGTKLEGAGG